VAGRLARSWNPQTQGEWKKMVIVRFEPGDSAPRSGHYLLVGHYGESSDIVVCCGVGDVLPLPLPPEVRGEVATPHSYVLGEEEVRTRLAA
jgi:hypothetical protein